MGKMKNVNYGVRTISGKVKYAKFNRYAVEKHGVHKGAATLGALDKLYERHKGSRWDTIIEAFKERGRYLDLKNQLNQIKEIEDAEEIKEAIKYL